MRPRLGRGFERQVVSIYAGTKGYLDPIPTEDVQRFEKEMFEYMDAKHTDIFEGIRSEQKLTDDLDSKLKSALDAFAETFEASA